MSIFAILTALAIQAASTPADTGSGDVSVSPAMAAAKANKPRMKSSPEFIREPDYTRPDAAKLTGEFGEVVLSGIIGEDGKLREARISKSSRSTLLDAAALQAVPEILFKPALDGDGKPISIPANINIEYSQTQIHGQKGILKYRCGQFVLDYDWWYRTWPADHGDRIFKTFRGFSAMEDIRLHKEYGSFLDEWKRAIEACRASPNSFMLDMLKPHGNLIRKLIGN